MISDGVVFMKMIPLVPSVAQHPQLVSAPQSPSSSALGMALRWSAVLLM